MTTQKGQNAWQDFIIKQIENAESQYHQRLEHIDQQTPRIRQAAMVMNIWNTSAPEAAVEYNYITLPIYGQPIIWLTLHQDQTIKDVHLFLDHLSDLDILPVNVTNPIHPDRWGEFSLQFPNFRLRVNISKSKTCKRTTIIEQTEVTTYSCI